MRVIEPVNKEVCNVITGAIIERIVILEIRDKESVALRISIGKLVTTVENMVKVSESQDKRLLLLETMDGNKWRKASGYVITSVIGIILGLIANGYM